MKNLFYVSVLVMTAALSGCAGNSESEKPNYRYVGNNGGCSDTLFKDEPTVPVQNACAVRTQRPAPVVQAPRECNSGCPSREYTVRTPVRVVYKATTYRTVYEPRTYETTSYETRPYNKSEACSTGLCSNDRLMVRRVDSEDASAEELFGK